MNFDQNEFVAGDLLADTETLLWEDDDQCTTWLRREGDKIRVIKQWKNIRAVLEGNMREANDFSRTQGLGSLARVANIPMGIWMQWEAEGITDDPVAMARRLNDPDWAKLRTNNIII